ncbi:sensor histidine kinase [Reichenbachiella ulvae]|uniref:histidine kinase n=1 Tax=Reichenbachiella ulvae TaxID=2980104 RepID=A0ABT3CS56_9BACT|nr:GAF domain-containing protein [Reichenbachiella ulvae]MCV9386517.1 GAF domain-containing protein [Reichenbachiella ulvae]
MNYVYTNHTIGSNYSVTIDTQATFVASVIFLISILATVFLLYNLLSSAYKRSVIKNEELTSLKNSIEAKNSILKQYNSAMLELTRTPILEGNLDVTLEKVADVARDILSLPRVSIWFFSDDKQRLIKKLLIENGKADPTPIELHRGDFPRYFEAVENQPVIMAPLASSHPDTAEFTSNYLEPLNIKSMLDCPIVQDKGVIGVICCEQKKFVRNWVAEDALIIQSLADFIAMHFKNQKIKTLMTQLTEQNKELSLKSNEIASMNQELHGLNQKLIENNSTLEDTVRKRTKELITQNNQLKEYAFVNSHMLRAPLSSILGLSNILQMKSDNMEEQELLEALFQSTNNLDEIVRKISSTLEDGSNLTRKDIDYIINERFKESEKE